MRAGPAKRRVTDSAGGKNDDEADEEEDEEITPEVPIHVRIEQTTEASEHSSRSTGMASRAPRTRTRTPAGTLQKTRRQC